MDPQLERALADLAADATSSASVLLPRAIELLRLALGRGEDEVRAVGRALCRAQPAMSALWNATALALGERRHPGALDRFALRAQRAPSVIARHALDILAAIRPGDRLHVTTYSSSAVVERCLVDLHRVRGPLTVACSEGRPRLEGRELAAHLAESGVRVELFTDAALVSALERSTSLVVGADTIAPRWAINKVGTRALAVVASDRGLPTYVLAGREKFVARPLADLVSLKEGPATDVWEGPPPGVLVQNPYFERIPIELVSAVISDVGALPSEAVAAACETAHPALDIEELSRLMSQTRDQP